jgi:hypothetical protein
MFHWIDVAIFHMTSIVSIIADQMLPEPPLPIAAFTTRLTHEAQRFLLGNRRYEIRLDQPPSGREVRIAWRQSPNRMDMFWKYDHSIDMEGVAYLRPLRRISQSIDLVCKETAPAVEEIRGKEPASSRNESAPIVWHGQTLRHLRNVQQAIRVGGLAVSAFTRVCYALWPPPSREASVIRRAARGAAGYGAQERA